MKYLCLIYFDENEVAARPADEQETISKQADAHYDELVRSGRLLAAAALQPTRTAVTIRVRDGRMSATEGPFAETHEQLGGVFLIEADDLNEAIQSAQAAPAIGFGSVEIRPIHEG